MFLNTECIATRFSFAKCALYSFPRPRHNNEQAEALVQENSIFMKILCDNFHYDNKFYLLFFLVFFLENAGEKPAANIAATPNKSITSSSPTTVFSNIHPTNLFRNVFCMLIVLVNLKDLI